jgi:3-methyladenine DNA glycosylase AlkD
VTASDVKQALQERIEPGRKAKNEWFFRGGAGQYSEGDQFIGIRVPAAREIAKQYKQLPLKEVKGLFGSPVHEHRLTAAMLLTYAYSESNKQQIFEFYIEQVLHNTTLQIAPDFKAHGPRRGIDNWDIVDSSAHKIVGRYVADTKDRSVLYELAAHQGLWQNRVAIVACWWLINKRLEFNDCIVLAEVFIDHPHDLLHKATGWMLREIGKQDRQVLLSFLDQQGSRMPRTMLRYAIERLPDSLRYKYLG